MWSSVWGRGNAMNRTDFLRALRRLAKPDRSHCLDCGHEYRCSVHGCAVIWAAVREIQILALKNYAPREDPDAVRQGGGSS